MDAINLILLTFLVIVIGVTVWSVIFYRNEMIRLEKAIKRDKIAAYRQSHDKFLAGEPDKPEPSSEP